MSSLFDAKFIAKTAPAIAILFGCLFLFIAFTTDIDSGLIGIGLVLLGAIIYSLPYIPDIIDALK